MADQGDKEKKGAIPPAENLAIRKAIMLPSLALSYKAKPIKIVKVSTGAEIAVRFLAPETQLSREYRAELAWCYM